MTRVLLLLILCVAVVAAPATRTEATPTVLLNPRVWKVMVEVGKFVAESVAQHEIGEAIDRLTGRNIQEELQQVKAVVEEEVARGTETQETLSLISSALISIQALLQPVPTDQDLSNVVSRTRRDLESLARMQREQSAMLADHGTRIDDLESRVAQVEILMATLQAIPLGGSHVSEAVTTTGLVEIPEDVTNLWAMFVPMGSSMRRSTSDPMSREEFVQRLPGLLQEACTNGDQLIVTAEGDEPGEWHSQWLKYNGERLAMKRYDSCDGCIGAEFPLPCGQ